MGLRRRGACFALLAVSAVCAPPAAGAPGLLFGFSESAPKWYGDQAVAPAQRLGAKAFRVTLYWNPGQTDLDSVGRAELRTAVRAASARGMRIVLAVFADAATKAPLDATARDQYCSYVRKAVVRQPAVNDVVVWNEPNSSTFWRPQFDAEGRSAAPRAYAELLARCYDVLHAFRPTINVLGLATAPRGDDVDSHSPGTFIRKVGEAYRASYRLAPLFDTVSHHVYGDHAAERPWRQHIGSKTISQGDWNKLMSSLAAAFTGTAQRIPGQCTAAGCVSIAYMESGFQTRTEAAEAAPYTGRETSAVTIADWAFGEPPLLEPAADLAAPDQATQIVDAVRLAYCQPYVTAYLNFMLWDETRLEGWQSGPFWADRTPKDSLAAFREVISEVNTGTVNCPALRGGPPSPDYTVPATPPQPTVQVEGPHAVELAWQASEDDASGVAGYRVYRNGAFHGWTPTARFTDTAVGASTAYSYTVYAQDGAGNLSWPSPTASVTTRSHPSAR